LNNPTTRLQHLQEAQLSQRDRAMLRVIECFAESLKVTQGHSKWYHSKAWYGFLFTFRGIYGRMFSRFWDI